MNDYCVPRNEFEWRDTLLKCGCSKEDIWLYPYSQNSAIWNIPQGVFPLFDEVGRKNINVIPCDVFLEKYRTDKPKTSYSYPYRSLEGRVRELELKNDLFIRIIQRLHAIEVKSALFDDILKRLTKLEKKSDFDFVKIPEGLAFEKEYKEHVFTGNTVVCIPALYEMKTFGSGPEACSIVFNPKASPKNIPFSIALEYMRAGRKVRQEEFATGWYWTIAGNEVVDADGGRVFPSPEMPFGYTDIVGNEWTVLPE